VTEFSAEDCLSMKSSCADAVAKNVSRQNPGATRHVEETVSRQISDHVEENAIFEHESSLYAGDALSDAGHPFDHVVVGRDRFYKTSFRSKTFRINFHPQI
jgi:hypothetical protein